MKHTYFVFSIGLAFLSLGLTAQAEQPSTVRKVAAGITSPLVTAGVFSFTGFATDALVKKLGCTSSVRPWVTGGAAALVGYQLFSPLRHIFNTLLSGDVNKIVKLVGKDGNSTGIMQANEESIREILREILYVKNRLVVHFANKHKDSNGRDIVLDILQRDLFVKDMPRIIGDMKNSMYGLQAHNAREVLINTSNLVPKKDKTNAHWWATSAGKAILWTRDTIAVPFTYARNSFNRANWNFEEDARLLATLGGKSIEDAAENLMRTVETIYMQNILVSNTKTEQLFNDFYKNAEILTEYAETVLKDLREQREAIQRVRDVVFVFKKPSSGSSYKDDVQEYSMNVLSQIYA